ncbi:MAG: fibronectin type III domain-containing protein [Candidatus Marinimicrobia bacterium]|nr:fibronectin type III domain-containing protein [Candidatus Neomarinimicrobiota bacterium]
MIVTGEGKMTNGLKAKTAMFTIFLTLATILAVSCRECPTEQPDYDIYLSAEDVFCTSIVLNVTLPDSGDVSAFALDRDDSTVATYTCSDDDTLIIDEDLTPDTDYTYRVRFMNDGKTKSESDPVTVHTMDTTSHDFIWEIDKLGNYGSYLEDAWIVDENNIWIVGNIETDSGTYNAARWDGDKWNLLKVLSGYSPNYGIFYFSENDIWVTSGLPIHWNGSEWTLYHLWNMGVLDDDDGGVTAIWASSPSDIYFVGRNGSIVHYDGSTFTKMESGTDVDLTDICGDPNGEEIWVCGFDELKGSVLLKKEQNEEFAIINSITSQTSLGQPGVISHIYQSLWTDTNMNLFLAATGRVYVVSASSSCSVQELIWWDYSGNQYPPLTTTITGTNSNDIFIAGYYSSIRHFNGKNWAYISPEIEGETIWFKIRAFENMVVVVGMTGSYQAVVARGHHQ